MNQRRSHRARLHPRAAVLAAVAVAGALAVALLEGRTRVTAIVLLAGAAFVTLTTWRDAPGAGRAGSLRDHLRPTKRAWRLLALAGVFAALPAVVGAGWVSAWVLVLVALLAAMALDALRVTVVPRPPSLDTPETLFVGEATELTFVFPEGIHPGAGRARYLVETSEHIALAPGEGTARPRDRELVVAGRVVRRGTAKLERLWIRATGPLGLMALDRIVPLSHEIVVTPDVRPVRQAALRFFDPRSSRAGLKIERYLGDGSEFDAMREYVPGFDARSISWRATARHHKLICHEFRAERNHDVVVVWDSGRLMSEPMEGGSRLDHAISAGLVMTYAALRTGDRAGAYAFGPRPGPFLAPSSGRHAFPRILQLAGGLAYDHGETNFTLGLTTLAQRLRRRTLIVILTDFVDTVTAELMVENLTHLLRRHFILFVSVQDPALAQIASTAPERRHDLLMAFVAGEQAREREQVLRRLARSGAHCIEAPAERIGTRLVNRYLEIRRRELV